MERQLGAPEVFMLYVQGNMACTYAVLGRHEEALSQRRHVYSRHLKLKGKENIDTLREADNYALSLIDLERFEEARLLSRRMMRVARRVLGASHNTTMRISRSYGKAIHRDAGATLDDLREAVTTLEDTARIARRVLGGAHPLTTDIEGNLQDARAALRARKTPSA